MTLFTRSTFYSRSKRPKSDLGGYACLKGLLLGFLITGCGLDLPLTGPHKIGKEGSEAFQAKVQAGATPGYQPFAGSYGLAKDKTNRIIDVKVDDQGNIGYIRYNFRTMPPLKASELGDSSFETLAQWSDRLGVPAAEWILGSQPFQDVGSKLRVITYFRQINGVFVKDARIQLSYQSYQGAFRLLSIKNRSFGPIVLDQMTSPLELSQSQILQILQLTDYVVRPSTIYVLKNPDRDSSEDFIYGRSYDLFNDQAQKVYSVIIDHINHKVLSAEGVIHDAQIALAVPKRSYLDQDFFRRPLAFIDLVQNELILMTKNNGEVNLIGEAQLMTHGKYTKVLDGKGLSYDELEQTESEQEPATVNISIASPEDVVVVKTSNLANQAAFHAYEALSQVRAKIKSYLDLEFLDGKIIARTNIGGDYCNANYDGRYLNFYGQGVSASGNACENTALISDIVYHEWGHKLDDHMGPRDPLGGGNGITDSIFSEGIGDVIAMIMSDDPDIGRGLYLNNPEKVVRSAKNHNCYHQVEEPCISIDQIKTIHEKGTIISGAFYQLRLALIERYGDITGRRLMDQLFLEHLKTTESFLDSYQAILDLDQSMFAGNHSPNRCLIAKAFYQKGLADDYDGCSDDSFIASDPNIFINILSLTDGSIVLEGSANQAEGMAICMGPKAICLERQSRDLVLALKEHQGDRSIFISEIADSMRIDSSQEITIFALDRYDHITRARGVKLKPK